MVLAVVYSIGLIVAAPGRTDFSPSDENTAAATGISTEYENKLLDNVKRSIVARHGRRVIYRPFQNSN